MVAKLVCSVRCQNLEFPVAPMGPIRRNGLGWIAVALGFLIGFFALARFGMAWPPFGDNDPGWLLRWISYVGGAILGPLFIAATIVALRNPKRAGLILLVAMPFAVFCLAYPAAGYLVWHSDGSGWFEPPEVPTAIGLTVLFFLPIFTGLLALRRRRWTVYLFAATVLLAGFLFGLSHWSKAFLPAFAGWSSLFLLFGIFWSGTSARGWPSVLQPRSRSLSHRVAAIALTCTVVVCMDVAVTFGFSALGSSLFSGDCRGKPLFVHPESPYHAVFTARVIFVGRSIEALTRDRGLFRDRQIPGSRDPRVGDWGVGVVQERFWGLPTWSRLVLLTNFIYWKETTYFVDGSRGRGLLTRLLPIVEGGINCSRTKPVQDAMVDLRVLHESPNLTGTRLLGYVREPETFVRGLAPPSPSQFAEGVRISVTGKSGTQTVTTDGTGIYQVRGVPLGDYKLQLLIPDNKIAGYWTRDSAPATVSLTNETPVELNFDLFWNGRIEGHVRDESGKPVQAWVKLLSATGIQLPAFVQQDVLTNVDGSYQLNKIPAGRYKVMIDTSGREYRWPSEVQFYPSKSRVEDGHIFELSEGQRISGIDFNVPHLAERAVRVRVTWPNEQAAGDAYVCVAYEHTENYEPLQAKQCFMRTDPNGIAVIHVYGKSRVRVFANNLVHRDNAWTEYRSQPSESEANKMSANINLVLTSQKPWTP